MAKDIYANSGIPSDIRSAGSKHFNEDIYANEVSRPQMTRSHERNNTSGLSTAEVRCLRLTAVCVVLLVVLMMIAITVLGIKLVTEHNMNKKLMQERDESLNQSKQLKQERDESLNQSKQLKQERDQSLKQTEQIKLERDEAWKKLNASDMEDQLRWKRLDSSFYYFSDMKNWTESRQDCIERGADLVIINSKEKRDFIEKQLQGSRKWIGLTDIETEGQWKWVDGTKLTFKNWGHNQPDDYNNDEDCAEMGYPGTWTWNDRPCSERQGWICEKRGGV